MSSTVLFVHHKKFSQKIKSLRLQYSRYQSSILLVDCCCIGYQVLLFCMDPSNSLDDKSESRLYVGNLDLRISEATLIKMFSSFGKIVAEDFLWHTRGPKRGEPRGYAFVQFSTKEEAVLAKEKMHGRLVCGRPLVVRLASEKYLMEGSESSSSAAGGETSKSNFIAGSSAQMSKSAKIAAIKNKLKAMEEGSQNSKRQKNG
ncbi:uncharacterized protein LOC132056524 isoform X1 [Lycium ferocissimum]|uniref:uncharacterized protein LOC132056524 isoform X1 n=1 Tax=Lycium ferocissimum TaxID=112874 RepID=UPI002814EB9F|nr:uncharacterized protein LOC132056524 isoform X1 [Lycium ferocissimum]